MNNLIVTEFIQTIQDYNPEIISKLDPPVDLNTAKRLLDKIGIQDDELVELYSWKNGLSRNYPGNQSYFHMGWLQPIERVVERVEEGGLDEDHLVPIIRDESGDDLVFNRSKGSDYGKIHVVSAALLSIVDPFYVYKSFKSLLQTTIEAYKMRALYLGTEENDWLKVDYNKYRSIAKKLNPECKFWAG